MYEDEMIIKQPVWKILKENDKLYLWLDNLKNSSADLDGRQLYSAILV